MSEYTATIKLKADRSGLTGELKIATEDVAKLNEQLNKSGAAGNAGADGIRRHRSETKTAATETRKWSGETKSLIANLSSLKALLVGYGAVRGGTFLKDQLAQFQDTRTMLQGLTDSSRDYQETQNYLIDISERYSKQLNTVSESYARLLSLENADLVTKQEARQLTEGLLNASAELKVNNQQLGQVYFGLAQGMSQTILRAEELSQVVEPLPGLLTNMDRAAGLTSGGFRQMVNAGEVTSEFFKATLIQALSQYEGAAERTYENISSVQNRIATQHTLLAASLETPINASIGSFLEMYEDGLKSVIEMMPTLIELGGDLITITSALVAIKISTWFYGVAAGAYATLSSLGALNVQLMASIAVARTYTVALAALGGPWGVAILAATAIYAFGNNSADAAIQTSNLRQEIDQLSESYAELTLADIDKQIADQRTAMAELADAKNNMSAPVSNQDPYLLPGDLQGQVQAINAYKEEVASIDSELASGVAKLNALAQARAAAVNKASQEDADAARSLTELQQELLETYLPLDTATKEYMANLAALNAIETDSAAAANQKQRAIDALNAEYEEEVKELTGVTAAEKASAKAREETLQSMTRLIDQYAPLQNLGEAYETNLRLISQAYDEGLISLENYQTAVAALAEEQQAALQPGADLIEQMESELATMRMSVAEQEFLTRTRGLSKDQIEQHGDAIRALIQDMLSEQNAIDQLQQRQQDYARLTENMLEDLQQSWFEYFDQVLEKGKFNVDVLKDSLADLARQALASSMSMDLSGAFRSTLDVTEPTATTPGSTSINWGSVATLFGGGVSNVLNASIAKSAAPVYEGGKLISEGAKSLNFDLRNIGTNLMAGLAGSAIGTGIGEAVFGKEAQSSYGAAIGGVVGSMIPGVGTFLGSMLGGGLDAAFGGDGYKRMSIGFDTAKDSVKHKYYYGTETFASGLQVNKINRRGEQDAADALIQKYAEIDAFITSSARGSGYMLEMMGKNLSGTSGDYGYDDGTFFGMRAGESADTEQAVSEMMASFARQLIGNIEGLSEELQQAISSASGDADEVLAQFQQALQLDQLVQSGALDALGENIGFTFAEQLSEAAGGVDNLIAVTELFNSTVVDSVAAQESAVVRLRDAVTTQFDGLNLVLSDFTSVAQFREYFDSVKDSISASDVLELMQAGNALAVLIDQEAQLAEVRTASMAEQINAAEEMFDAYIAIRTQANALAGSIQNDIFKLSGNSATDLRSRLRVGGYDEQLDVVDQLREQILNAYNDELRAKQQLHEEAMQQYEEQLAAASRIEDYIKGVMTGDLSPLSLADRLSTAQSQFDQIYSQAMAGDLEAAQKASGYFDNLAKLNQQANASSVQGVDLFYQNLDKLEQIGQLLAGASAPGELDESAIANQYLAELQSLQTELVRIQSATAVDLVSGLGKLELLFEQLPDEIADALMSVLPGALSGQLQMAANFGILSDQITGALGLLPQKADLSSSGIASAIEAITMLSQHPQLMANNIQSLSAAMGQMISTLLQAGAPTQLIADTIAQNQDAVDAANDYLGENGLGSVSDYQSNNNPNYSSDVIADSFNQILANAQTEYEAVAAVVAAAAQHGVGSAQLAASDIGFTQSEILALAAKYGFASFAVGTDRVDRDQFAQIHKEEIIFDRPRAARLRDAVVKQVENGSLNSESMAKVVNAINEQTAWLAELVAQGRELSDEQRQVLSSSFREISEAVDRLTREMEDQAA